MYSGICCLKGERWTNIADYIQDFISGNINSHMWFFIPLFSIYLSIPFLRIVVEKTSDKMLLLYLLLSFVFCSIFPTIFLYMGIDGWKGRFFPLGSQYIYLAVLGYVVVKRSLLVGFEKVIYILGGVSFIIQLGVHFFSFLLQGKGDDYIIAYTSPTVILISLAVFVWFKNHEPQNGLEKYRVCLLKLSSCTLGVYLVNDIVLNSSRILHIPFNNQYVGVLLTYIVSVIIVLVIKRIPIVKLIVP